MLLIIFLLSFLFSFRCHILHIQFPSAVVILFNPQTRVKWKIFSSNLKIVQPLWEMFLFSSLQISTPQSSQLVNFHFPSRMNKDKRCHLLLFNLRPFQFPPLWKTVNDFDDDFRSLLLCLSHVPERPDETYIIYAFFVRRISLVQKFCNVLFS